MRKIVHIDMDAFYSSVEQRDNPAIRGRPVIVGGRPDSRGVVSSCSYEARRYGVRSAMSSAFAFKLCPNAVFLPSRFEAYRAVSRQIHEIFRAYSDLVEPLSLDEAYIDVTENKKEISSATIIAQEIRKRIKKETGLTASAGVSYNKFIAKAASDFNKPDGIKVVKPAEAAEFLDSLPIGKFYGIGAATERRFLSMGITHGRELRGLDLGTLVRLFGKAGAFYYDIVRGIDTRHVEASRERQSVGKERTLSRDIDDTGEMLSVLSSISEDVAAALKRRGLSGKAVTLKVKYPDFTSVTRSCSSAEPLSEPHEIMKYIPGLLARTEASKKSVRLLGISVSGFERGFDAQLSLPFKN